MKSTPDEKELKAMVDRFLKWKLPETFCPDRFIGFNREAIKDDRDWPTGTNLFSAPETLEMLKHIFSKESTTITKLIKDLKEVAENLRHDGFFGDACTVEEAIAALKNKDVDCLVCGRISK